MGRNSNIMGFFYSSEKNVQLLIALMKEHNIKKIVLCPGSANVSFSASVQSDDFFEIYSCVDERSAAYMACGLAAETGEAVAINCTGATASRNFLPALTEAFYRQLPILAITATQPIGRIGSYMNQVIDRTNVLNDVAKISVHIPPVNDDETKWECEIKINKAILELFHRGGGPAHINLTTTYSTDFSLKELPKVRAIKRFTYKDELPTLNQGKIGIFVGSHCKWNERLTEAVDTFCRKYNAVVLCDQASNYKGEYGVYHSLIAYQQQYSASCEELDVVIHIGEVSASGLRNPKAVWRVNPDGEIRDTFKKLKYVFEMEEVDFFEKYNALSKRESTECIFYKEWSKEYELLLNRAKEKSNEIPFSNYWTAIKLYDKLPLNSVLHLGILTSLRSWNFLRISNEILAYSNTGGFGIDGGVSSLIGASLANKDKIYFGIVGDLAFFYDLNSMGNRHVDSNIRIMLINNGLGTEFKYKTCNAIRAGIGEDTNTFIAAAGHFGNKSPHLVKHFAEDLGFEYISASNKNEFEENIAVFTNPELTGKPMIFEVFTESDDETIALDMLKNLESSAVGKTKELAKKILGEKRMGELKKILKKN